MPLTFMSHTEVSYAAFAAFALCLALLALRRADRRAVCNTTRADQSANKKYTYILERIGNFFGLNEG
jgi:hypothetical protein